MSIAGGQTGSVGEISGLVEPGFEGVRDAFAQNFADGRELGAAGAHLAR